MNHYICRNTKLINHSILFCLWWF